MELLVFGRRRGEDGGNGQHHGGPLVDGAVTHLVDHDGGQDDAQNLEENTADQNHWSVPVTATRDRKGTGLIPDQYRYTNTSPRLLGVIEYR